MRVKYSTYRLVVRKLQLTRSTNKWHTKPLSVLVKWIKCLTIGYLDSYILRKCDYRSILYFHTDTWAPRSSAKWLTDGKPRLRGAWRWTAAPSHFQPRRSPFSSFPILSSGGVKIWKNEWRIRRYRFGHRAYGEEESNVAFRSAEVICNLLPKQ